MWNAIQRAVQNATRAVQSFFQPSKPAPQPSKPAPQPSRAPTPVPTPSPSKGKSTSFGQILQQPMPTVQKSTPQQVSEAKSYQTQQAQNISQSSGGGGGSSGGGGGGSSQPQPSFSPSQVSQPSAQIYQPPSPPSLMESIARKLQEGVTSTGKGISSGLMGAIERVIQPQSKAYAQEGSQGFQGISPDVLQNAYISGKPFATPEQYNKGEGFLDAIKRSLGGGLDIAGQGLANIPLIGGFLGKERGWSEGLAGQPTIGTGTAPTSRSAGFSLPTLIGKGGSILGAETGAGEDLFPQDTTGGGYPFSGGVSTQTPEVGDFLTQLANEILSTDPGQFASVATPEMDSWVQMAKDAGLDDQQATLEAVNKQIQVVSDLLDNLDSDITEESKNFLMTEAQRRRLVATRGKPLRDQLTKLVAGASKYGVNIKNTLAMLEQQISMKKSEAQQRLESQKAVTLNQQNKIKNLTSLLPYMGYTTGGQELAAQTRRDTSKNQEEDIF